LFSFKNVNEIERKNTWISLLNNISMIIPWKKLIQAHDLYMEKNTVWIILYIYIYIILNFHLILKIILYNFSFEYHNFNNKIQFRCMIYNLFTYNIYKWI